MKRYRPNKFKSKKRFRNGAVTVHRKNKMNPVFMRGGIRL